LAFEGRPGAERDQRQAVLRCDADDRRRLIDAAGPDDDVRPRRRMKGLVVTVLSAIIVTGRDAIRPE
jgi:hypothetical protein